MNAGQYVSDAGYLRDLAERLRRVPVMYGTDDHDISTLHGIAANLDRVHGTGDDRPEPDTEAYARSIVAAIAGGVVWQFREDWIDVKDAYREWINKLDDFALIGIAEDVLNPGEDTVNADHD